MRPKKKREFMPKILVFYIKAQKLETYFSGLTPFFMSVGVEIGVILHQSSHALMVIVFS
jgi:hypothetical protein